MAVTKYKGLTVEIGGNTTKLKKAMGEMRAEGTVLKSHLGTLNKLIEFNPASTELLAQKQRMLGTALSQNAVQYATLKRAEADYIAKAGPHTAAQQAEFRNLQRRIAQVSLEYERLKQEAIQFGSAASTATLAARGKMQSLQQRLKTVSNGFLAVGVGAGIMGALALKSAISFEKAFADVRKTIIATDEEYEELAHDIRQMALEKPVTPEDLAYIESLGGQLNIATQYLTKFTSTVADLDVATDMNLEDASLQLARFSNIAGMSQGDIDRLGATLVDLGNNSATTESQIMLMAMRIVGSASNIGMSAPNVMALATALSSVGIQAEMGGNAISTIMNRIDKDVALSNDTLQVWAQTAGMSAQQFSTMWKEDVTSALIAVVKGMGTFRDEGNNLNLLLKDMGISYMRQVDTMQRMSRTGDLMADAFARSDTAWDQNIALVREATQRYETADSKMKIMQNSINEVGITIGNEILPYFKELVVGVTGAVQAFADMDEGTKQFIITAGGLVTVGALGVKGLELLTRPGIKAISMFASLKTAMAFYTAEQTVNTASTAAHAAATEADAVATGVDVVAKRNLIAATAQEAQAQNFATVAKNAATLASGRLAAALGLQSALSLGLAGIIGVAAVGAVAALSVAFVNAANDTKQYTKATMDSKKSLDDAQVTYDRAVEEHGELSNEALAARDALNEERAAFEANAEEIDDFCARMGEAVEAHQKTKEGIQESSNEARDAAGKILNLSDQITELSAKESKGADDHARLSALTNSLSMSVDGLSLSYDQATGSLNMSTDAMRALVEEEAKRVRAEAALENLNSLYDEQAQLESDLAECEGELNAARENVPELLDMQAQASMEAAAGVTQLSEKQYELTKSYEECQDEIRQQELELVEMRSKTLALEYATDDLRSGTMSAADAAAYYSDRFGVLITEADVLRQEEIRLAEAEAQRAADVSDLVKELEELEAENGALVIAIADSGMSLEEFATRMQECGIKADDLSKGVEEIAEKTSDAFNKIEYESDLSLSSMVETLEHNIDVTRNWGNNMAALYERAGTQSQRNFVQYIGGLGVEYAPIVEQLLNDTSGQLERLSDLYAEAGSTAPVEFLKGIGMMPSQVSEVLGITEQEAQAAFDQIEQDASQAGADATQALADGMGGTAPADAMANLVEGVDYEAGQLPGKVAGSTEGTGSEIADGIYAQQGVATQAADDVSKQVADHLSSATTDAHSAGSSMTGEHFRNGLDSGTSQAVASADRASKQVADHLSSAKGDAWWAGYNMMMGATSGVNAGKWEFVNAARNAVREATEAARQEAEINSPSKKWRRIIGWGMMEGGTVGIRERTSLMSAAAVDAIRETEAAALRQTSTLLDRMRALDGSHAISPSTLAKVSNPSTVYVEYPTANHPVPSPDGGTQINNEWNITADNPEEVAALVAVRQRRSYEG